MLVEEAAGVADYQGLPEEEIAALLVLEAGLNEAASSKAAETLVAVLGASVRAGGRAARRPSDVKRARPLSGIQLFGAQEAKRRLLGEVGSLSIGEIHEYSKTFRYEMRRKFNRIQLQHLDNGTEQRLSDLYVEPDLLRQEAEPHEAELLKPADLLELYARAVIQGPAGSGKSTTVRRLAAEVAGRDEVHAVPIVVELRKYSAQQQLAPQIFIDHIQQVVGQVTQQTPPAYWLEYILATGRAVIFFDGLDEVLNAGTRAEVRDAVLSFAQIFPASSIVVTSRFTGYDLAPLDNSEWAHLELDELHEDQVHDYATRWFRLKSAGSDVSARAASFIEESRMYARDLRANPLMLSLLCSVYYVRGDIPRTLHALYERCADMIYQQWNTMRGIDDHRAWDKDVRPILYHVAHAVLGNDDYLSFGIPEDDLIREIRRAFTRNGAPNPEEASRRARETVRLWAGRAWILTSVMTDAQGRSRYGFVHQSFLEYFAAVYEVRRVDTPKGLYKNLRSRLIELNGWAVTQIAVSVIQDWKERGGERFLKSLLDEVDDACDLDAFALWRLAVSLVSIVPVPASQLARITTGGIAFVARSVVLPQADEATYEANYESDNLSRDLEAFERESDDNRHKTALKTSREEIRLPTAHSDAVLRDLADAAANDPVAAAVIADAVLACLASERDEIVVAALLQSAILKDAGAWPDGCDTAAGSTLERRTDSSWVVIWLAAQLSFLAVSSASAQVPWHALLLTQELVLSDEVDMSGPNPFSLGLVAVLNEDTTFALLETIGEAASRRHAAGLSLPAVPEVQARSHFVFAEPASWQQARDSAVWSDAFLVTFSMLGKLAAVAWNTSAHALGELIGESPRDIVRQIAASSAGWGVVDPQVLAGVAEPYRGAIQSILMSQWPKVPVPPPLTGTPSE